MTHLSLTEGDTEWGAHVTDAEYGQTPAKSVSRPRRRPARRAARATGCATSSRKKGQAMTPPIPTETHPSPGAAPACSSWPNAACRSSPGPVRPKAAATVRRPDPERNRRRAREARRPGRPSLARPAGGRDSRRLPAPPDAREHRRLRLRAHRPGHDLHRRDKHLRLLFLSHRDPTGGVGVDVSIEAVG